jgi:hypothetical protein
MLTSPQHQAHKKRTNDRETTAYCPLVIIGAGAAGVAMGCQLKRKLNFDRFQIYERRSGIGGKLPTSLVQKARSRYLLATVLRRVVEQPLPGNRRLAPPHNLLRILTLCRNAMCKYHPDIRTLQLIVE